MTKKQTERMNRLMPNGQPKFIRVYDNDGSTFDRYTVVFTGSYNNIGKTRGTLNPKSYFYVGMSGLPFHPQGVCQHGESEYIIDVNKGSWGAVPIGKKNHLGKRVLFDDLPDDCKKVVISDYKDIWNL
jgi:hypothetical protein